MSHGVMYIRYSEQRAAPTVLWES